MRIGIDISVTQINQAGTSVYTRSLVEALQRGDDCNEYCLFSVAHSRDMNERKTWRSRMDTLYRDLIWTHVKLPRLAKQASVDILHMPANVMPLYSPCPTVVTILDTTIFESPRTFPFWLRNYFRLLLPWAAKRAAMVLTISEHSKQDIIGRLGIASDKVVVTYLAASSRFRVLSARVVSEVMLRYHLEAPFILAVGTLEPRKNLVRLLQAMAWLRQKDSSLKLVHAGPRGWLFDDVIREVERLGLQESVHFLGRVPLDDLVALYNAATVFVYPSLYEGFGLPVLEAMSCGCPVVTSELSSLPEVAGDAGMLVDPRDVRQLAEAIERVLEDKTLAQRMRECGLERAKLFSWEQCAQETLAVYRWVLSA